MGRGQQTEKTTYFGGLDNLRSFDVYLTIYHDSFHFPHLKVPVLSLSLLKSEAGHLRLILNYTSSSEPDAQTRVGPGIETSAHSLSHKASRRGSGRKLMLEHESFCRPRKFRMRHELCRVRHQLCGGPANTH